MSLGGRSSRFLCKETRGKGVGVARIPCWGCEDPMMHDFSRNSCKQAWPKSTVTFCVSCDFGKIMWGLVSVSTQVIIQVPLNHYMLCLPHCGLQLFGPGNTSYTFMFKMHLIYCLEVASCFLCVCVCSDILCVWG